MMHALLFAATFDVTRSVNEVVGTGAEVVRDFLTLNAAMATGQRRHLVRVLALAVPIGTAERAGC